MASKIAVTSQYLVVSQFGQEIFANAPYSASAKGESEMDLRLGENLYWAATIIAGLIVVAVVTGYVSNAGEGEPFIPIVPLVLAGAIWLVGWACRYVFARR